MIVQQRVNIGKVQGLGIRFESENQISGWDDPPAAIGFNFQSGVVGIPGIIHLAKMFQIFFRLLPDIKQSKIRLHCPISYLQRKLVKKRDISIDKDRDNACLRF